MAFSHSPSLCYVKALSSPTSRRWKTKRREKLHFSPSSPIWFFCSSRWLFAPLRRHLVEMRDNLWVSTVSAVYFANRKSEHKRWISRSQQKPKLVNGGHYVTNRLSDCVWTCWQLPAKRNNNRQRGSVPNGTLRRHCIKTPYIVLLKWKLLYEWIYAAAWDHYFSCFLTFAAYFNF